MTANSENTINARRI